MDTLGPVSAHLARTLTTEANQRGLLVWLDGEGTYTELVTALHQSHQSGTFSVPVVPFTGSFLDQMRAIRPLMGGLSPTAAVIHMPGFNEEEIRKTPALEAYHAGKRWRMALPTLVRDASVGRVTPTRLQAFLDEPDLTLAKADVWLARAALEASGELADWLESSEPTVVLQAMLSAKDVQRKLLLKRDLKDEVSRWFERTLGVDTAWRGFVDALNSDRQGTEMSALAPITHALCVEYVHDLKREPAMAELTPLKGLPDVLVAANLSVARWFRSHHKARYESLANDVQGLLRGEIEASAPEDLGQVDTFRFEESMLMRGALVALEEERFEDALQWAEGRRGEASFWASLDPRRRTTWSLIACAARLGSALKDHAHLATATWHSQEAAMDAYADLNTGAWQVDAAHRRMETERAQRWDLTLPHVFDLEKHLSTLRGAYRDWANSVNARYVLLGKREGFLPDAPLRQRALFQTVVCEQLRRHPRQNVAYVLVDAMRYEMATELARELQGERAVDVRLESRLAECPTDTWLGMNVLALSSDGHAPIDVSYRNHVHSGPFAITGPETRQRAMADGAALDAVAGLRIEAALDLKDAALKKRVDNNRLLVIHSDAIDKAGEVGQGLMVFDRELTKLRSLFQRLRLAGVHHVVVTADHGFLLNDPETIHRLPFGNKVDPKRRYALHPAPAQEDNQVTVSPHELGLSGVDGIFAFPTGTQVFDRGMTKDDFVHGGLSLQERVIPLLRVTFRSALGKSNITFALEVAVSPATNGRAELTLTASIESDGTLAFGGDNHVDIAVDVPDRTDVDVSILSCTDGEIRGTSVRVFVGTPARVQVSLVGPQEEPVRLELSEAAGGGSMPSVTPDAWFGVRQRKRREDDPSVTRETATVSVLPEATDWLNAYEDEAVRIIFAHLREHGSLSEAECTNMLGTPRAFRRFSRKLEEYAQRAPFDVRVERINQVKRYVRVGGAT
jgi:hypothetical protein